MRQKSLKQISSLAKDNLVFRRNFAKKKGAEEEEFDQKKSKMVVSKPESPEVIEKNLSSMFEKEADMIDEDETGLELQKYLKKMKYEIKTEEGKVTMTRKVDAKHSVTIAFSEQRSFQDDPLGLEAKNEEEDAAAEGTAGAIPKKKAAAGEEETEATAEEEEPTGFKHDMTAEITFFDSLGKSKGKWSLIGYAGEDSRLYIEDMKVEGKEGAPALMEFDVMSHDLQDKVYDLLDSFAIDDNLGRFIQDYVVHKSAENDAVFLRSLKKLLTE
jgi:hypothetical protein